MIAAASPETSVILDQSMDDGHRFGASLLVVLQVFSLPIDAMLASVIGIEKIPRHAATLAGHNEHLLWGNSETHV